MGAVFLEPVMQDVCVCFSHLTRPTDEIQLLVLSFPMEDYLTHIVLVTFLLDVTKYPTGATSRKNYYFAPKLTMGYSSSWWEGNEAGMRGS